MRKYCGIITFKSILAAVTIIIISVGCVANLANSPDDMKKSASAVHLEGAKGSAAAIYLANVMDSFQKTFDVYTDAYSAGNHFADRRRIGSDVCGDPVAEMDEAWPDKPHSGTTCIKASFESKDSNWGGWYFMNGVLGNEDKKSIKNRDKCPEGGFDLNNAANKNGDKKPIKLIENWGEYPEAGFDLSNATKLTFWARGETGGERVEFFALGTGRDPVTGDRKEPYPDSTYKVSTCVKTLSSEWEEYSIDLSGRNLGYVIGGFGWVASAKENKGRNISFYIDDVRYNKPRLADKHFLVSYQTTADGEQHSDEKTKDFDNTMRNVAFTYDNSVALLAFIVSGDKQRAQILADSLVYAMEHDRFYTDDRLRNAYMGGDLVSFPGWTPNGKKGTARMPGWYDAQERRWDEDMFQVSTHTGNVAWAMLALLGYYEVYGGDKYLSVVEKLGDWVQRNCRDERGPGGYTGGFEGWEPNPAKLTYKATEHNIDLYAAFNRLARITRKDIWKERADHARKFIEKMWDKENGMFWTGTTPNGVTAYKEVIPVDIQAWAILALGQKSKPYLKALDYAQSHLSEGDGFRFSDSGGISEGRKGIWYEGTAQMAAAYYATGQKGKWAKLVSALHGAQFKTGGMPAADINELYTGFKIHVIKSDGTLGEIPWLYYHRAHVGATAWLVLAEKGINPFVDLNDSIRSSQ